MLANGLYTEKYRPFSTKKELAYSPAVDMMVQLKYFYLFKLHMLYLNLFVYSASCMSQKVLS